MIETFLVDLYVYGKFENLDFQKRFRDIILILNLKFKNVHFRKCAKIADFQEKRMCIFGFKFQRKIIEDINQIHDIKGV